MNNGSPLCSWFDRLTMTQTEPGHPEPVEGYQKVGHPEPVEG